MTDSEQRFYSVLGGVIASPLFAVSPADKKADKQKKIRSAILLAKEIMDEAEAFRMMKWGN